MTYEIVIRLGIFLIIFLLLLGLEYAFPRRKRVQKRFGRWIANGSLSLINTLGLRLVNLMIPFAASVAAYDASVNGVGLFNYFSIHLWIEIFVSIIMLDFVIWCQHWVTHKIPFLWSFHRVHHADRDMDVTTAIRFHPFEIFLSMLIKIGAVYVLGPAVFAVILFEIILNATAIFNHANLAIPKSIDKVLRVLLVTPDMHRIHHSRERKEHDTNFGFALSVWDRIFKTYKNDPIGGQSEMQVGLDWQDGNPANLTWTLLLPFFKK